MEMNQIIEEFSRRFLGSRIKVTQKNSPAKTMRFERRVERVEISKQKEFIELHLNKDVPIEYGLHKGRIIHFHYPTRIYQGILSSPGFEHHVFEIELVGVRYVDYIKELEKFGVAIAGLDLRIIMFEVLSEKFGSPVVYGQQGKLITETFSVELMEHAREFLKDKRFVLTDNQIYVIEKYLSWKNFISGGVHGE